jgi:hypothetical protein
MEWAKENAQVRQKGDRETACVHAKTNHPTALFL